MNRARASSFYVWRSHDSFVRRSFVRRLLHESGECHRGLTVVRGLTLVSRPTLIRGLTLVEVVAALVLLATTVTALLAAHADGLRQLGAARDRQIATTLARERIAAWTLEPPATEAVLEGTFATHPAWRWVRTVRPSFPGSASSLLEITLTITRYDARGTEHTIATYVWLEKPDEMQQTR